MGGCAANYMPRATARWLRLLLLLKRAQADDAQASS